MSPHTHTQITYNSNTLLWKETGRETDTQRECDESMHIVCQFKFQCVCVCLSVCLWYGFKVLLSFWPLGARKQLHSHTTFLMNKGEGGSVSSSSSQCVYVCVRARAHLSVCVSVRARAFECVRARARVCVCLCVRVCVSVCVCVWVSDIAVKSKQIMKTPETGRESTPGWHKQGNPVTQCFTPIVKLQREPRHVKSFNLGL